jgi:hypothetical protein
MTNLIDCKYEENLVVKLEKISQKVFSFDANISNEEEIELLNLNTKLLNDEIANAIFFRNELIKSKKISPSLKTKIKTSFVPSKLLNLYDNTRIEKVQDLLLFVQANQTFFRDDFASQDKIFESISKIDPLFFRSFDSEYPSLSLRIQSGPISATEVNEIIQENGFDSKLFAEQIKTNRNSILNIVDRFMSTLGIGISIMGTFCALVENVFATSKNKRDLSDNPAEFLTSFANVLSLINPSAAEVVFQVQNLISLIQKAKDDTDSIKTNLQNAFQILASAFGIVMNFFDPNTGKGGSIEVNWNLPSIKDAITFSNPLMLAVVPETEKPLGDINQDGVVDTDDATALQSYIDEDATDEVVAYVENVLLPYMNANASTYAAFADFPTASDPESNVGTILSTLSSVVSDLGIGEDFGLSNILTSLSIASGIISSVQALVSGSRPVNIEGLFSQLDQIIEEGSKAIESVFEGFEKMSDEYKKTVEDALKEAEKNAIDNPEKTSEINTKNKESLKENYSKASTGAAETSKILGPNLIQTANKIKNGIKSLAAVGVLQNLDKQLISVIDASVSLLKVRLKFLSVMSLDNGYHFNMGSSYAKMSGKIASAEAASSDATTEEMKNSVRGLIAQSAESYRQKNKEEVEFVVLRFCKLAGEIERIYREVSGPIEDMIRDFQQINTSLTASGNETTLRAIRAGAIRYDTETRLAAMRAAGDVNATITSPFVNAAGLPSIVPGGNVMPTEVFPPLPENYEFPTYEEALRGARGVKYRPGPASALSGRAGFTVKPYGGLDSNAMKNLYNLASFWNVEIIVSSAYRSWEAQKELIRRGTYKDKDGRTAEERARSSRHFSTGDAFDCTEIKGRDVQLRFMNFAYRAEFRGFGSYLENNFVHIDTGSARGWGNFNYYDNNILSGPLGNRSFR